MLIKREDNSKSTIVLRRLRGRRWLLSFAVMLVLMVIVLSSIYYGMILVKTGQSMTMNAWATGLARAKLGVVGNFIDGLTARPERIEIDIKFKDYQKLAYKREQALREGILISKDGDWVPAKIRHNGETYKVELRLKGDLSVHWQRADRWSYKIKVKGNRTLFGMKRFAIQDPQTRDHLNEWIIHKLQNELGLISLRYDFIDVTINGKHQPIYALEENFEKRLVENNRRREGPILKYDQWFYWLDRAGLEPQLAGASVSTYQQNRYTGDSELAGQYEIARSLLDLYRRGEIPASKVFDLERFASLFALSDLTGYYHATHIDNLKYYYNPVTSLIEPIGYDFNVIAPVSHQGGVLAEQIMPTLNGSRDAMDWRTGLFLEDAFYLYYIDALRRISDPAFLDEFFEEIADEYRDKMKILHKSYPYYNFEGKPVLYANQEHIRGLLNPTRSLQVYYRGRTDSTAELEIHNIFSLPAEILALTSGDRMRLEPVKRTIVPAYDKAEPIKYFPLSLPLPATGNAAQFSADNLQLVYRLYGLNGSRSEQVYPWPAVNEELIASDIMRQPPNIESFDWLKVNETDLEILIPPGRHTLRESMILPAGYKVHAGEGTVLNLVEGALMLSYSPVYFKGSEESPIRIVSSDSSGQGLVVMSAGSSSELKWVEFSNLSNPSRSSWSLTGAVTFYESPVTILHCRFADNHCEDALNTIRGDFRIEKSSFVNTQSDAFDADFCSGVFFNTVFIDCGNDGIDVSGSVVEIDGLRIDGAGDKGISAGENSRMTVRNCTIRNAEIAVAGKDQSLLTAENLTIRECRIGFTAFQKKPEFAPGVIRVSGLRHSGSEMPYLIEEGSSLVIDGKTIPPSRENVKDILYGVEYGKSSK